MTDPVCGMHVEPKNAAAAWQYDGTTYYFCSTGCLERFQVRPSDFVEMDPADRHM